MRNAKIVVVEAIVFACALSVLYRMMLGKNSGIPRKLIAKGHERLDPQYRRKVDRTVGGWLRRIRVAGESWARAIARGKVFA